MNLHRIETSAGARAGSGLVTVATRLAETARTVRDAAARLPALQTLAADDITRDDLADTYAQSVCYGLFAARWCWPGTAPFERRAALRTTASTHRLVRAMFDHASRDDLDASIAAPLDALAEYLAESSWQEALASMPDPVVQMYEHFLAALDPSLRALRGVYYTPAPVVSYVVRSLDALLSSSFGLDRGILDPRVRFFDPAAGTGAFLHGVVQQARERSGQTGPQRWPSDMAMLTPRLAGCELLPAAHAIAHVTLAARLGTAGDRDAPDLSLDIQRRNALGDEPGEPARGAADDSVLVMLGNPPYAGHSANSGHWIASLLRGQDTRTYQATGSYFEVDGVPLGERNPKWLNDDYVKFMRYAQRRIEQNGRGVMAFVCNHGYIDHPTFRGMRHSLLETFDSIRILDLNGNVRRKRRAPDGSHDANVFDVQQGVCIGLFVRNPAENNRKGEARAGHHSLWGSRADKLQWLSEHTVNDTPWQSVQPRGTAYGLVPQDVPLRQEYERGWKLTDVMPVYSVGVVTSRDGLVFDIDRDALRCRIEQLRDPLADDARLRTELLTSRDRLPLPVARAALRRETPDAIEQAFVRCLYRPFDVRWLFYHDALVERSRREVMRHMLEPGSIGLIARRQMLPGRDCTYFGVARQIISDGVIRSDNHGSESLFPLYLADGSVNLAPSFLSQLSRRIGMSLVEGRGAIRASAFTAEHVLAYIYALFHSPEYRRRYAEGLREDFPRVPITASAALFTALVSIGQRLVQSHSMPTAAGAASFPVTGGNVVERVRHDDGGRVWINDTQYFEAVTVATWEFHVGGYDVCRKWLKDRVGCALSPDEIAHYRGIVAAIDGTRECMLEVDALIAAHGDWPLDAI